jgi:hypothetical protein
MSLSINRIQVLLMEALPLFMSMTTRNDEMEKALRIKQILDEISGRLELYQQEQKNEGQNPDSK